jgi:K+-sensing histidine kinase KdpD
MHDHHRNYIKTSIKCKLLSTQEKLDIINIAHANENFPCKKRKKKEKKKKERKKEEKKRKKKEKVKIVVFLCQLKI